MAKRGALSAALACHAPGCESFAAAAPPLLKRRRAEAERKEEPPGGGGGGGGGLKRKRAEEEEEAARAAKRPSVAPGGGVAGATALSRPPGSASARGGRPKAPLEEPEDDVWRYNSFQYWRSPLPAIDLSDILDLEKDGAIDARRSSSVCLSEMET
ncbi:uncharacterized protein C9orf40 homolog [Podarcis raffonei]|uniref:uncharacterized protein C9orf40 homolog n=1 Tax=Podarcis raffonei TaxID=65483 RepID=UPI0023296C23|nr:uncharacterized protein C9orf40 homolog [Podarcis raffonei]